MTPRIKLAPPSVNVDANLLERMLWRCIPTGVLSSEELVRLETDVKLARTKNDRESEMAGWRNTLRAKIRVKTAVGVVIAEAWEIDGELETLEAFLRLRDRLNQDRAFAPGPYAPANRCAVVERCAYYESNPGTDAWENVEA